VLFFRVPGQTVYVNLMPRVLVRLCTDSFSTEVKEPNPRCAAGNVWQAKIINPAKTARLVLDNKICHYNLSTRSVQLSCVRAANNAGYLQHV